MDKVLLYLWCYIYGQGAAIYKVLHPWTRCCYTYGATSMDKVLLYIRCYIHGQGAAIYKVLHPWSRCCYI